jgi:hypothetical protein
LELIKTLSAGNGEKGKPSLNNTGTNVSQKLKVENKKNDSLLLLAIQNGHFKLSKMLIHVQKADVNCTVSLNGRMTNILIAALTFCLER